MKKIIGVAVVLSLVFLGTCAFAADKTGFVDMKNILRNSDAGNKAYKELSKTIENKQALVKEKEQEIRTMEQDLKKQRAVLTESGFKEKELEYQKKTRDFKRLVEDSRGDIQRKDKELSQKLIPEVVKIIQKYGDKEGYMLILDVDSPGLVYHAKAADITQDIIKEFNKTYK